MALNLATYNRHISSMLDNFSTVSLTELNTAKLLDRFDKKYLVNLDELQQLLPLLSQKYSVLEIDNIVNHNYTTHYYDTPDLNMYMNHHNKRLNRYKIRQRLYNSTNESFLEIKFKNNKGQTIKRRVKTESSFRNIPISYHEFINQNSAYQAITLKQVLENNFDRFTLTNKQRNQRITIDTNLSFWYKNKPLFLPQSVIIEVKSTRTNTDTTIFDTLREMRIKPSGMSKYSIGLALLEPELKQNLFKQKIRTIKKLNHVS